MRGSVTRSNHSSVTTAVRLIGMHEVLRVNIRAMVSKWTSTDPLSRSDGVIHWMLAMSAGGELVDRLTKSPFYECVNSLAFTAGHDIWREILLTRETLPNGRWIAPAESWTDQMKRMRDKYMFHFDREPAEEFVSFLESNGSESFPFAYTEDTSWQKTMFMWGSEAVARHRFPVSDDSANVESQISEQAIAMQVRLNLLASFVQQCIMDMMSEAGFRRVVPE